MTMCNLHDGPCESWVGGLVHGKPRPLRTLAILLRSRKLTVRQFWQAVDPDERVQTLLAAGLIILYEIDRAAKNIRKHHRFAFGVLVGIIIATLIPSLLLILQRVPALLA